MAEVHYYVVPHKDGWAYRLGEEYSNVYASVRAAADAAKAEAIAMFEKINDTKIFVPREDGTLENEWTYGMK